MNGIIRWFNRQHRDALTGLITAALLLGFSLWGTAIMNWPMGSIGVMGVAALMLIVVFFAPIPFGITALATRFSLKSIFDLFLMIWIVIACLGSVAILAGITHYGVWFPAYVFFPSLIVAALVRSGKINLEFWMRVIAVAATVLMLIVTLVVTPEHMLTAGVAGPEAVEAVNAEHLAAKKKADRDQADCIKKLKGYTKDQALGACPLKLGVPPVPQAPRELTAIEKAQIATAKANLEARRQEALDCIDLKKDVVSGYTYKGQKFDPRALTTEEVVELEACTAKLRSAEELLEKYQHASEGRAAGSPSFMQRQEEVINKMAKTLPDWMPDWAKVALAWTLALVAAHGVYFAIAGGIGVLLIAFGLRKKGSTTSAPAATKSASGYGWGAVLVVAAVVVGAIWYVQNATPVQTAAQTAVQTGNLTLVEPFLTQQQIKEMKAYIISPAGHPLAGKPLPMRYGVRWGGGEGLPLVITVGDTEEVIDQCPLLRTPQQASCSSTYFRQVAGRPAVKGRGEFLLTKTERRVAVDDRDGSLVFAIK